MSKFNFHDQVNAQNQIFGDHNTVNLNQPASTPNPKFDVDYLSQSEYQHDVKAGQPFRIHPHLTTRLEQVERLDAHQIIVRIWHKESHQAPYHPITRASSRRYSPTADLQKGRPGYFTPDGTLFYAIQSSRQAENEIVELILKAETPRANTPPTPGYQLPPSPSLDDLKHATSHGLFAEVAKHMIAHIDSNPAAEHLKNDTFALLGRHQHLSQQIDSGTITQENRKVEENQIRMAFLNLLDNWQNQTP